MPTSDKYWDKISERYAKSQIADEASYQRKLAETQEFLKPHMTVAEFGCGTGTTTVAHAPHVRYIDAIDVSEKMLEIGRSRARDAGVDNITFHLGTLHQFNAAAASFDAVLGLNVIHLIKDRQALFAEVARVIKPGGVFVSSTVCLRESALRYLAWLVPAAKLFGLAPDVFILSEDELVQEVSSAGFRIERRWHHAKGGIAVFLIAIREQESS